MAAPINERPAVGQLVRVVAVHRRYGVPAKGTYPRDWADEETTYEGEVIKVGTKYADVAYRTTAGLGMTSRTRFVWSSGYSADPYGNDKRRMFTDEGWLRHRQMTAVRDELQALGVTINIGHTEAALTVETYQAILAAIRADPATK